MSLPDMPRTVLERQPAHRLINSKYPPIAIFDDVADGDEFEALFAIQQLTNPRLQNQAGQLNLLPTTQIPFGIAGCSYACAPFTHVNPDGSRFSDAAFGVLYLADQLETAIAEVLYHQQCQWQNIPGLHYDSVIIRALKFDFSAELTDISGPGYDAIHHPNDYSAARAIGGQIQSRGWQGIQYRSVRQPGALCWALMTPVNVAAAIQAGHYEFIYDGSRIGSVRQISAIRQ